MYMFSYLFSFIFPHLKLPFTYIILSLLVCTRLYEQVEASVIVLGTRRIMQRRSTRRVPVSRRLWPHGQQILHGSRVGQTGCLMQRRQSVGVSGGQQHGWHWRWSFLHQQVDVVIDNRLVDVLNQVLWEKFMQLQGFRYWWCGEDDDEDDDEVMMKVISCGKHVAWTD